MSRDPVLRLADIVDACDAVAAYVRGMDEAAFRADRRTIDAVLRNLEIVGEAVKHLPAELTGSRPGVPWSDIAGFRDVLAHGYFSIDLAIVWDVVTVELVPLQTLAAEMLRELDPP